MHNQGIRRQTCAKRWYLLLSLLAFFCIAGHCGLCSAANDSHWEKTIPIVLTPDDNYAPHAGVAIISILENSNPHYFYRFYVVHGKDLSKSNKDKLLSINQAYPNCEILCIEGAPRADQLTMDTKHWGKTSTYRLFLPELQELSALDKLIYLDCDVTAVSDISEFYDLPMDGKAILGMRSIKPTWHIQRLNRLSEKKKRLTNKRPGHKTPAITNYMNSGVLLMDLGKLRKLHFPRQAVRWMNKYNPTFPDQDTINILLYEDIKIVEDLRWAYPAYPDESDKPNITATLPIVVYHYVGPFKPWSMPTPGNEAAIQALSEYHRYRMQSPWRYKPPLSPNTKSQKRPEEAESTQN